VRKFHKKQIYSTGIFLLVLVLIGVWWQTRYVTYTVDELNMCGNGLSTAVYGPTHDVRIRRSSEAAFLKNAELNKQCVHKK
jgi:hypothetical protein